MTESLLESTSPPRAERYSKGTLMIITPLYHWSPADRREQIERDGLRTQCDPTTSTKRQDEICLSPSPLAAWEVSGDLVREFSTWDLWQVELSDEDEVHVIPMWGPQILEVRVTTGIPASRIGLVASRIRCSS